MAKKLSKNINIDHMVMSFAQLSTALVVFIIGNTLVVLIANLLFPREIVLGHHLLSPFIGALFAMTVVALIAVGIMPVVEYLANQRDMKLENHHWLILYWLVNAGGVWIVTRFAEVVGLGVSSWLWAVLLGLFLDLVQGALMIHVVSKIKSI